MDFLRSSCPCTFFADLVGSALPFHFMKKTSILVFIVTCSALFVACTHRVSTDVPEPVTGTGTVHVTAPEASEPARVIEIENTFVTVRLRILPTSFEPAVVNVQQGQQVKFSLESVEEDSTFTVEKLGINVRVPLDQPMVIDVPTGMTGSFTMVNTLAGSGAVSGQIVIE